MVCFFFFFCSHEPYKDNTTIVGTTLDPSGVSDNLNHTEPTSELPATTTTLPSQSSDNTTTIDGSITTDTESTDEKPNSTLPGSTEASVTANSSSGAESVVDSTTTVIFNDTMTTQVGRSCAFLKVETIVKHFIQLAGFFFMEGL